MKQLLRIIGKKLKSKFLTKSIEKENIDTIKHSELKNLFDKFKRISIDFENGINENDFEKILDEIAREENINFEDDKHLMFKVLDTNHNGFLKFDEFLNAFVLFQSGETKERLSLAMLIYLYHSKTLVSN